MRSASDEFLRQLVYIRWRLHSGAVSCGSVELLHLVRCNRIDAPFQALDPCCAIGLFWFPRGEAEVLQRAGQVAITGAVQTAAIPRHGRVVHQLNGSLTGLAN